MDSEMWDELAALERRMDDLFWAFMGPRVRAGYPTPAKLIGRPFAPTTEVFERKGDLVARLDLPGIDPEKDLTVEVDDGELVMRGERRQREEIKEETYHRLETRYGGFERRVRLPADVDPGRIAAEYKDGVLEVVIPGAAKALKAPRRAVPVRSRKELPTAAGGKPVKVGRARKPKPKAA
jgi:HSP20 family protein